MKHYEAKQFVRFSDWLRVNMTSQRLTQKEVATYTGLSQPFISQLVNNKYTPGTLETVRRFANAFEEDLDNVWDLCW